MESQLQTTEKSSVKNTAMDEVRRYMAEPETNEKPFDWWRVHQLAYLNISRLAKDI